MINNTLNNLKSVVDDFNVKFENFTKTIQEDLEKEFQKIFDAIPELGLITWNQYTPYFNDGDECVFRVNDIFAVHKEVFDDEEYSEYCTSYSFDDDLSGYLMIGYKFPVSDEDIAEYEKLPEEMKERSYMKEKIKKTLELSQDEKEKLLLLKDFIETLESIPDDIMKTIYGNHVDIKIKRGYNNKIETIIEEFDHE